MDIEKSLILKGAKDISDKILSFINSLVIKNQQEADLYETDITFEYYEKLRKCKYGLTKFTDHYGESMELPIELQNKTLQALDTELVNGNPIALQVIQTLRNNFINNYIDKNPYYAVISGNPISEDQVISIINRDDSDLKFFDVTAKLVEYDNYDLSNGNLSLYDVKKSTFPNFYKYLYDEVNIDGSLNIEKDYGIYKKVPLHKIRYRDYPNTYIAVFTEGIFEKILSNTNYEYLKYITLGLDIYKLRESDHFDILYYSNIILEEKEIDSFFDAYNITKEYVLKNKYIKGIEEMYNHYSNFELMVILFGTFQKICISYVDTYSVRHYTDKEIYDILDSNNLSSIKTVDIDILKKIIENLDILLSYRGTEEILPKIMEIASLDNSLSIKKYDLVKKFNVDDVGSVGLKKERGMYNKNVDLAFVDRTIATTESTVSSSISADNQIIDYESFVIRDKYWGKSGVYETEDGKNKAILDVKNKLLKMEFNRLETKYIGAISIINMFDKYQYMTYKIGLLLQYYGSLTELKNISFLYNGMYLNPLEMYTLAACANKHLISIENPDIVYDDTITEECYTYERMMKLNTVSKLNTLEILLNLTFESYNSSGKPSLVRVGNILKSEDISKYIIYFDNSHLSFKDIMKQYDDNYQKLNNLIFESMNSNDYLVAMSWKTIVDYFLINVNNEVDYILPTTFTDFFTENGGDAYSLFETYIVNGTNNDKKYFARTITKAFRSSIGLEIDENEITSDIEGGNKIASDLNLLIKAFVSIYIELRDVTISLNMSDFPFNIYQFMDKTSISDASDIQDFYNMIDIFTIKEFEKTKDTFSFTEIPTIQERL